ncbi:alpha/beta hydrolase [Rhizobium sp. AG855]|uniref:alpha/beta fold hydrolase n=1 Tax=Rhizobium sp. AG855 TaxID=2183898 RepID=UPI0011C4193B|nr:alpha/beta hydrolase [Rhizobium sp. AG855]
MSSTTMDAWRLGKRTVCLASGRNLAVVDTGGEGDVALLLHGYTDTSRSYQALAPHLAGLRLVIPDLPGHGDSDEDERADLSTLVEDMMAVSRALDVVPSLVVGHSFGSLLALEIARREVWPGAKFVILAGTPYPNLGGLSSLAPIRHFADPVAMSDPFLTQWYAGPVALDPQFLEMVKAEAVRMPARIWRHYLDMLESTDLREGLGGIRAPLLSIAGDLDHLFDARHGNALCQVLPDARIVRLPDSGHNPHWEAPERVAGLIRQWLTARDGDAQVLDVAI